MSLAVPAAHLDLVDLVGRRRRNASGNRDTPHRIPIARARNAVGCGGHVRPEGQRGRMGAVAIGDAAGRNPEIGDGTGLGREFDEIHRDNYEC